MKTRAGDRDVQHLIEGDRDELLIRAGLMTVQPDRSAPDYNAEIASQCAETPICAPSWLHATPRSRGTQERADEKVVEKISAKLAANGRDQTDRGQCR